MANEKKDEENSRSQEQVPASYAEKAMSSLLRLHDDLVEEKEKRIDLYRRLMEREQELAEVRSYVQLLESELARQGALPPGASGFLPAPGRDEEARRLQSSVSSMAGAEEWAPAQPQQAPTPWASVQSSPTTQPSSAQSAGTSQTSSIAESPSLEPSRAQSAQTSQGSQVSAPSAPSQRSSEQPAGRAPVVAWIPSNTGGSGGGAR